jgi:hypothetical protein
MAHCPALAGLFSVSAAKAASPSGKKPIKRRPGKPDYGRGESVCNLFACYGACTLTTLHRGPLRGRRSSKIGRPHCTVVFSLRPAAGYYFSAMLLNSKGSTLSSPSGGTCPAASLLRICPLNCDMSKDVLEPGDFHLAVRRQYHPRTPWRWEIWAAGRSRPVEQSKQLFATMSEATRQGKAALRRLAGIRNNSVA